MLPEGIGKRKISESNPAGEDIRLGPDFEVLSTEIEKLSSPSGTSGLDWNKVVAISSDITLHRSKDILVVCYLSVGLLNTEGLSGLASGVGILRDLIETYWENLFPPKKRMKARRNAIEWWIERVRSGIASIRTEIWPEGKKKKFIDDLKVIDEFLGENMDEAPVMSPLIKNIEALIVTEEKKVEETRAGEQSPKPEKTDFVEKVYDRKTEAPISNAGKIEEVTQEIDASKLIGQGLDSLGRAASLLARQEQPDPLYFRLNRMVAWIPIISPPPAVDGRTLIPPPDWQIIEVLRKLYRSGSWRELLQSAESRVPEFLFWLDLSRYTAESLEKLGLNEAAAAVAGETSLFVERLPGIEKLSFADGTPFADEDTREWLKVNARGSRVQPEISVGSGRDELYGEIEKEMNSARELIKANKLPEALSAFREKFNLASSARERFLFEIGFCRLLMQAKRTDILGPYLRDLLAYIDTYKIDRWEPSLAMEALLTALSGIRLCKEEGDEKWGKMIIDRIALLDPVKALELL